MFRVYACITEQHDLRLVFLAGVICVFACYAAFNLLGRANALTGRPRLAWLSAASVVTGSGVWATHFVAMLAFRPAMPINYDLGLTALSVIVAIVVSGIGFLVALNLRWKVIGGAIVGAAVGSMHYGGMAAVIVPATKHWDAAYLIASIVIGVSLAAAAARFGLRANTLKARLGGTGLLTLAICGLHFTAMAAFVLRFDPTIPYPEQMLAPELLAIAVAAVTILIVALGFAGSIFDQRMAIRSIQEMKRLRRHIAELEETKCALAARTEEVTAALEEAAAGSRAKSQFLATMSHELRTPLNAIIGFSEIQMSETFGPIGDARYVDYARDINTSGVHLLGLINDVLDFSKLDAGKLELNDETVDVGALVEQAAHLMECHAEKSAVVLTVDRVRDLPPIRGDVRRLRQVLFNLISNGIKFTPEGGEVKVSACRVADGLSIAVADTGIGMKPEHIPKALDHFGQIDSRLSREYEGTGLGLPLAKRLVELHDGSLDMESVVDRGTTVTVTLPESRIVAQSIAA